jgi:RimJ/RimL family protein N-acetyltransferase
MFRLQHEKYHLVLPLLQESQNDIAFAYSLINQVIEGDIFVDNIINPRLAVLKTDSNLIFITGEQSNELEKMVIDFLRAQEKRYVLSVGHQNWAKTFSECKYLNHKILDRIAYKLDIRQFRPEINLKHGMVIKRINKENIFLSSEFNEDFYQRFWGSTENFLNNSFGFYLFFNNQLVCTCTSIFTGGNITEIAIHTEDSFRGKGFGCLLAQYYLSFCKKLNITPRWDCYYNNYGSQKLAIKLGFTEHCKYSFYIKG